MVDARIRIQGMVAIRRGCGRVSHAEMRLGDTAILLGGPKGYESPRRHGHVCQYVVVAVDDVDRHFERAKRSGAEIISDLKTQPWGDREYRAKDPEGHVWFIEQHLRAVSPEDWGAVRKVNGKPRVAAQVIAHLDEPLLQPFAQGRKHASDRL